MVGIGLFNGAAPAAGQKPSAESQAGPPPEDEYQEGGGDFDEMSCANYSYANSDFCDDYNYEFTPDEESTITQNQQAAKGGGGGPLMRFQERSNASDKPEESPVAPTAAQTPQPDGTVQAQNAPLNVGGNNTQTGLIQGQTPREVTEKAMVTTTPAAASKGERVVPFKSPAAALGYPATQENRPVTADPRDDEKKTPSRSAGDAAGKTMVVTIQKPAMESSARPVAAKQDSILMSTKGGLGRVTPMADRGSLRDAASLGHEENLQRDSLPPTRTPARTPAFNHREGQETRSTEQKSIPSTITVAANTEKSDTEMSDPSRPTLNSVTPAPPRRALAPIHQQGRRREPTIRPSITSNKSLLPQTKHVLSQQSSGGTIQQNQEHQNRRHSEPQTRPEPKKRVLNAPPHDRILPAARKQDDPSVAAYNTQQQVIPSQRQRKFAPTRTVTKDVGAVVSQVKNPVRPDVGQTKTPMRRITVGQVKTPVYETNGEAHGQAHAAGHQADSQTKTPAPKTPAPSPGQAKTPAYQRIGQAKTPVRPAIAHAKTPARPAIGHAKTRAPHQTAGQPKTPALRQAGDQVKTPTQPAVGQAQAPAPRKEQQHQYFGQAHAVDLAEENQLDDPMMAVDPSNRVGYEQGDPGHEIERMVQEQAPPPTTPREGDTHGVAAEQTNEKKNTRSFEEKNEERKKLQQETADMSKSYASGIIRARMIAVATHTHLADMEAQQQDLLDAMEEMEFSCDKCMMDLGVDLYQFDSDDEKDEKKQA